MAAAPATMRGTAAIQVVRRTRTPQEWGKRALLYLVLIVGAIGSGFPFFWMVLTSLKTRAEAVRTTPTVFPTPWYNPLAWEWHNYIEAWTAAPFGRYFVNTTFVAVMVVIGMLFTSVLAAYAFARMEFWGKNVIFALFLATMMIPFETTLIPNYIIVTRIGWYNNYLALIVPWIASVVNIFLLRQFFASIPQELYDAASLDGCGHLRTLWSVMLPLARAPLAATVIFSFLGSWNSLLWPLMVTSKESLRPIQLGLSVFVNTDSNEPQQLMAAATFTIAPIIVLYFLAQRQFIEGIASSGLKG
jgi:multiple sugar transport system permease protein